MTVWCTGRCISHVESCYYSTLFSLFFESFWRKYRPLAHGVPCVQVEETRLYTARKSLWKRRGGKRSQVSVSYLSVARRVPFTIHGILFCNTKLHGNTKLVAFSRGFFNFSFLVSLLSPLCYDFFEIENLVGTRDNSCFI